ncbi:hypothetical protein [Winogradskyella sp. 3972H.M.0a.05]|uniref:hypothetical protein n=1 Tax=Winogradskyella sp. 3972H.M.0a.05 TaxID=2950277 RepID=UPI0033951B99
MEINKDYSPIYEKFNSIRDDLRPKLILSNNDYNLLEDNGLAFITDSLKHYSSSDIKRLFILVPEVWFEIDRNTIKQLLKDIDNKYYAFEAFHGLFLFLFDIIRLDLHNLLAEEITFNNKFINEFIKEKRDVLKNNSQKESIEFKFIDVDKNKFQRIKQKLSY